MNSLILNTLFPYGEIWRKNKWILLIYFRREESFRNTLIYIELGDKKHHIRVINSFSFEKVLSSASTCIKKKSQNILEKENKKKTHAFNINELNKIK